MDNTRQNATFNARVIRGTGCWGWSGTIDRDGYAVFNSRGKNYRAHRWSLEQHLGRSLAPGEKACHSCDVRCCTNPAHLWVGTQHSNVQDMIGKERDRSFPRGSANVNASLTEADVVAIRAQYAAGGVSYATLGSQYGISRYAAFDVVKRRTWAWVN